MVQGLYVVAIEEKGSGRRFDLKVWAETAMQAVSSLKGIIGPGTEYYWTGTAQVYENNVEVTREVY